MRGKEKCNFLKGLRARIAEKNGISGFEIKPCSFQGECSGTCPACESDLERLTASVAASEGASDVYDNTDALRGLHGLSSGPVGTQSCGTTLDSVSGRTSESSLTGKVKSSVWTHVPPFKVDGGIRPNSFESLIPESVQDIRGDIRCDIPEDGFVSQDSFTPSPFEDVFSEGIPLEDGCAVLPVFGISRLRINTDGPGVITLVGVQGCPLSCKYCINSDISAGTNYTKDALFELLKKDSLYFEESGGGVCFGGHEPLLQPDFILDFIKMVKGKGLNWRFGVETSLNVKDYPRELMKALDFIIVDIKSVDPVVYSNYTGGASNELVLESLRRIASDPMVCSKAKIRVPLIPGFNDFRDIGQTVGFLTGTLGFPLSSIEMFEYIQP